MSWEFLFLAMPTPYLIHRTLYSPQIKEAPNANLGIIVVIPCYNESNLLQSLSALYQAKDPNCSVEIIVLINDAINTNEVHKMKNLDTHGKALFWAEKHNTSRKHFHIIYHTDLPYKKAGVGLARKIGMDEAVFRLEAVDNPNGIIVGFDADSTCDTNYFIAIEKHFQAYPKIQAASIWYEHPLSGKDFDAPIYQAIAEYELHLRYFTLAKRFANYPHAFETIGSSMAVRANAYQLQGGMNTRKAGEDFYFLNKFIVLGKLNELNTTKVIPSPRTSDRVPFGTGKAVGDLIEHQEKLNTYAYQSFIDLKGLIEQIPIIYNQVDYNWTQLPASILAFFKSINFENKIAEIRKNTTNYESFEKRFFRWLDPFLLMKFVHFSRDQFYPNISVVEAGQWILKNYFRKTVSSKDEKEILQEIRYLWLGR